MEINLGMFSSSFLFLSAVNNAKRSASVHCFFSPTIWNKTKETTCDVASWSEGVFVLWPIRWNNAWSLADHCCIWIFNLDDQRSSIRAHCINWFFPVLWSNGSMFLWFFGEVFVEPNWVSISGHVLFLETERFGPQIKRPEPSPIATTFCLVSVIRWSMTSPILSRCTLPRRVRNLGVIWLSPFFQPNGSSSSLNEASRGLLHSDVFSRVST